MRRSHNFCLKQKLQCYRLYVSFWYMDEYKGKYPVEIFIKQLDDRYLCVYTYLSNRLVLK